MKALLICVLVAAGVVTAVAVGHEVTPGTAKFTCTGASLSFDSFPTGSNIVTVTVKRDGTTIYQAPFTFTGPSGVWNGTLDLSGTHTIDLSATWTADGGGSFDSGPVPSTQFCSTVTTTVTQPGTTITVPGLTTTLPATTVTTPATTVTNVQTSTVTTPAVTVVTAGLPVPGQTITLAGATTPGKTTTVKSKPKLIVKHSKPKVIHVYVTRTHTVTLPAKTVTVTKTVQAPRPHAATLTCKQGFKMFQGHCVLNDGNG